MYITKLAPMGLWPALADFSPCGRTSKSSRECLSSRTYLANTSRYNRRSEPPEMQTDTPDVLLVTDTKLESQAVLGGFQDAAKEKARPMEIGRRTYFDLGM